MSRDLSTLAKTAKITSVLSDVTCTFVTISVTVYPCQAFIENFFATNYTNVTN